MRILLLANNWVGWKVAEFLRQQNVDIVGLIIHPTEKQKYTEQIVSTLKLMPSCIFDGSKLSDKKILRTIEALKPELGISILFDYILQPDFLNLFPRGCINLHPSYLPFGRGSYPNVFSIIEGEPAGVTLHYLDAGIDTGDIIAQTKVSVKLTDTGKTLYRKLERASIRLFQKTWPDFLSGKTVRTPQKLIAGSQHRYKDVEKYDQIDLQKKYQAQELIDIIRARTFSPYKGAYISSKHGEKIYLSLKLLPESLQKNG